ncbi:MAG: universal stress protein [Chloroflexi bacterium]|nr:universal stress protein [Chloroflexota bacterium]MDA1270343.1 universal stress protein [Chloroflexota bacterium]
MYDRILVPLDGSPLAERILPFVRLLGRRFDSHVQLLRMTDSRVAYLTGLASEEYGEFVPVDQGKEAQDYLDGIAETLSEDGLEVSSSVHEDVGPAAGILEEAERLPATLIAMCTHGRSGVGRWLIGSVTDKIMRSATVPTLVTRAAGAPTQTAEAVIGNIIIPLDGSDLAEQALPHGVSLARELGLGLTLARAVPSVESISRYFEYSVGAFEHLSSDRDKQADEYLDGIVESLDQPGGPEVEKKLLYGDPAVEIIEVAKEMPTSLVVMTSHGRSGISRWALGSVADRVVRHSEFPVLLVPTRQGEHTEG